jgi:hypothetical protein
MPGDEIGVEMRQDDVPYLQFVLASELHVSVRIALWVNDGCRARRFVSNDVRRVRQTRQIELFQDHAVPPRALPSFGCDPNRM